jgi:thiamine-monophosphate kinase
MNEFDFIEHLRRQAHSRKHSTRVIKGIGDDASIISETAGHDLVVTTDLLVEAVDFHREATPARLLGHKSLAVSLSDIAAMGARPFWAFLSIGLPRADWDSNFKEEFYEGFFALADRYGVTLAGGDVSETREGIVIDSIVLGEVSSGRAIRRSGAKPGDQIYVTGNLGAAAAGLKLIELGARVAGSEPGAVATGSADAPVSPPQASAFAPDNASASHPQAAATGSAASASPAVAPGAHLRFDDDAIQSLLLRQLQPQPRVGWGIILGEQQLATAMIDLSDGLSSDLHHLCRESNLGALIDAAAIPLDDDVKHLCGRRALDPLALALHGGEDFELLFTISPENVTRLPKRVDGVPISRIGEITSNANSIRLREKNREWDLHPQGFIHFQSQ